VKFLLDTSVYSQPIKKNPLPSVVRHWRSHSEQDYAISAICELEIRYGIALSGSARLLQAHAAILKNRFPILPVDEKVAIAYAELQAQSTKKGKTRPSFDLLIASTAFVHRLILATCNAKDFADIPGLQIEDWDDGSKSSSSP
jgi:toxin FitB